jgi:hypothetical protein
MAAAQALPAIALAAKLLRVSREKVCDVIEAEPDRLREVDGIGPVLVVGQKKAVAIAVRSVS